MKLPLVRYWIAHVLILEPVEFQQQLERGLAEYLASLAMTVPAPQK